MRWGASSGRLAVGPRGGMEQDEEVQLPTYTHVDKVIAYPASTRPLPPKVLTAPHVTAFFDGGAAKKLGTGGYAVFG